MNNGHFWTEREFDELRRDYAIRDQSISLMKWSAAWGKSRGLSSAAVRGKIEEIRVDKSVGIIRKSPYPRYDNPLVMEGDALVLPDIELPFHDADFINRVLDIAQAWNIRQAILAGDVLHFDSLSGWEPNWTSPSSGGMNAETETQLLEFAKRLGSKKQGELMELIGNVGTQEEQAGISNELGIARRELRRLAERFDKVDCILGNHEGRFLRALQTAIDPQELLRLLETGDNWRIAPYYYEYLDTVCGRYMIEHPKGYAESTAQSLAAKFNCHVIMGHSHQLDFSWDISGKYYAIQAGCCVDEARLPYASQRHTTRRQHKSGAVIVRNGYPWLLHQDTDWEAMRRLA